MSKVKVAVIGCGMIGTTAHIPAYQKNSDCEIKYFCDIIPERAQEQVEKNQCGIAITDYHTALQDPEIEAISICTPNVMHPVIAIDALDAGKNVLCEKPAAKTYAEALAMQQAQHRSGKVLNIGVVNRFNTAVNEIKKVIQSGSLGEIYHVYTSFRAYRSIPGLGGAFTTKAIAGGGALIDWGVHYLDIVMYCCGDPKPLTASGRAFCELGRDMKHYVYEKMWSENTKNLEGTYDVDDSVAAFIRTDGPAITVHGAWAQNIFHEETYIDFMGTKGGIRLQYGKDFEVFTVKDGTLDTYKPEIQTCNHFQNEIDAFVACVRSGKKLPSHIDTVIITAKMMQGIYDSSEAGREVVFD